MAQDVRSRQSDAKERLKSEAIGLVGALGDRAVASLRDRVEGTAGRLTDFSDGGGNGGSSGLMTALTGAKGLAEGKSPLRALTGAGMAGLKEKVTGMFKGGGGGGKGKGMKVTNIIEQIDVGAPISLTYNLWTQFSDFPSFMKKVESVDQEEDQKLNWRAQVLWSHRNWQANILEQVPDDKIIWRSEGAKGYVDGAVTFHELAPRLTRIIMVLEYHPQGFFEHTGNLWRAQGRRARLELKHFRRHLMSEVLLHPDEIEGWRGEIHEGEVVDQQNGDDEADERAATEQDAAEQHSDERQGTRGQRSSRASRAGSDEDEEQPGRERGDRGGRRERRDRVERAGRTERPRRASTSASGSAERARRPTSEGRRPVPGQRARSERSGGERSGSSADTRRSAK